MGHLLQGVELGSRSLQSPSPCPSCQLWIRGISRHLVLHLVVAGLAQDMTEILPLPEPLPARPLNALGRDGELDQRCCRPWLFPALHLDCPVDDYRARPRVSMPPQQRYRTGLRYREHSSTLGLVKLAEQAALRPGPSQLSQGPASAVPASSVWACLVFLRLVEEGKLERISILGKGTQDRHGRVG